MRHAKQRAYPMSVIHRSCHPHRAAARANNSNSATIRLSIRKMCARAVFVWRARERKIKERE